MGTSRKLVLVLALIVVIIVVAGVGYVASQHDRGHETVVPSPSSSVTAVARTSPSPEPTVAGVPRCHTSDLTGAVLADNAAAGTTYDRIVFTNAAKHSCTMYGYAGVSLVDPDGQQLGKPATRSGGATAQLVELAAGQKAQAMVGFPVAGNFDPDTCSAKSASLQVYPPDETAALTIPFVAQYCPGFSAAAVTAAP